MQNPSIANLNDAFRRSIPNSHCFVTRGVMAEYGQYLLNLLQKVREFDTFTPDNDPYGEHDFGAFTVDGQKFFWKIDYYSSEALDTGAEDPGSPGTVRVLTLMLADEW